MAKSLTADHYRAMAASLTPRTQAFIGGGFTDAQSGKTFDTVNPATGQVIAAIAECDAADVDRAVAIARATFDAGHWSAAPPRVRKKALLKLAELMLRDAQELALLETLDMGKPIRESVSVDVRSSAACIQWYGEWVDKLYDELAPARADAIGMLTREPVGVVACVVPWNFPLLMASWKLGPALAAGNSVILKPAEQSPLTALKMAELAVEAGIPEGVFQVLPGFGPTAGKALGLHMDVDCLAFTGSTEVGKLFMQYAGQSNLKRVWLECGGKTPNVVLADVGNLDKAALHAAMGIFYNQGEVCTAASRLIVEEPIRDALLEKVIAIGKTMQPGDPLDPATRMGAIVDQRQMQNILGYVERGLAEGASLMMGGQRARVETGGYFVEPTIFSGVSNDMTIAREEIFGPVLSVISVKDADEAIKVANATDYGLAACVWTRDVSKAHTMARKLRAGSVWVNCYDGGDITMPFGGFKQSGNGRDRSQHALEKYTELKATWIDLTD
jgi:4-guanidinobutyraldehyde dehydrogenase/NAD-dependent aldehyde dehydrogenase